MKNSLMILVLISISFGLMTGLVSAAEPGDNFDTAQEISVPGQFSGELSEENEADFYKIYMEENEHIEIEFSSDTSDDGNELKLYNPDRNDVISINSKEGSTNTDDYMLANETKAGYWFIEVKTFFNREGNYKFDVSVNSQNDAESKGDVAPSFQEAYEIKQGKHEGKLQDLDEKDMYKILLQPGSNIEIEFSSDAKSDGNELKLYNPDRNDVISINSKEGSIETADYKLVKETETDYWFIEVKTFFNREGNYMFDISTDSEQTLETTEEKTEKTDESANAGQEPEKTDETSVENKENASLMWVWILIGLIAVVAIVVGIFAAKKKK